MNSPYPPKKTSVLFRYLAILPLFALSGCQTIEPKVPEESEEPAPLALGTLGDSVPLIAEPEEPETVLTGDAPPPVEPVPPEEVEEIVDEPGPTVTMRIFSPYRGAALWLETAKIAERQPIRLFPNSWSEPVRMPHGEAFALYPVEQGGRALELPSISSHCDDLFVILPSPASQNAPSVFECVPEQSLRDGMMVVNLTGEMLIWERDRQEPDLLGPNEATFLAAGARTRMTLQFSGEDGLRSLGQVIPEEHLRGSFLMLLPPLLASGTEYQSRLIASPRD